MRRGWTANLFWLLTAISGVALTSACGSAHQHQAAATSMPVASPSAAITAPSSLPAVTPSATAGALTVKWVELQAGNCLADPPPTDPSVVTVTVVDCGSPHAAEVYARAPVGVDGALSDIANRACAAGFVQYTGHSIDGSQIAVTYLIDSNQDRTTDDPTASTVICLLRAADGGPLRQSARR